MPWGHVLLGKQYTIQCQLSISIIKIIRAVLQASYAQGSAWTAHQYVDAIAAEACSMSLSALDLATDIDLCNTRQLSTP